MKALFLVFFVFSFCFAKSQGIEVKDSIINVGRILETHEVNITFSFKAKSDGVKLVEVIPDCACTVVKKDTSVFKKGEEFDLELSFSPLNRPGSFEKHIQFITTIDTNEVIFKGFVLPSNYDLFRYEVLAETVLSENEKSPLGDLYKGERLFVRFKNISSDTLFLDATISSKILKVETNRIVILPNQTGAFKIKVLGNNENFGFYEEFLLLSDSRGGKQGQVKLIYNYLNKITPCTEKCATVLIAKQSVHYGTVKEGTVKVVEHELLNTGEKDLIIYNPQFPCKCLSTEINFPLIIKPGESRKVSIKFDTKGLQAAQNKVYYLFTNDFEKPVLTMSLKGTVSK